MSQLEDDSRRRFLTGSAALLCAGNGLSGILHAQTAPAAVQSERPQIADGLQIGDVHGDRAVIWSRTDRPARMVVEWATNERFDGAERLLGPHALDVTDYTARLELKGLPLDREIFVRVSFAGLDSKHAVSEMANGRLRTPSAAARDIRFVWGGDTVGQGWGINPEFGGLKIYEAMRRVRPDFFIHSGDTIYADGPLLERVTLADGNVWRNVVTEAKSKVAQTLRDFRGNYRYNLLDENLRRFNAEVPQIWQWDDHEVMNNWSPGKDLSDDARYSDKSIASLAANAKRAFLEYSPIRWHAIDDAERVYRRVPYGPLLDVFVLDMRSYRAANSFNLQSAPAADTAYLGHAQIDWLVHALSRSRATWKVIASDMPLGLIVPDGVDAQGRKRFENSSNGDGPPLGRELEIAELLERVQRARVSNVVWLTADVHYCAAHFYDPARAVFKRFDPFWEFVAGPLHAGTFGPNPLDDTFGPSVVFQKAPPAGQLNLPPSAGYQFFGEVAIEAESAAMLVTLKDIDGNALFSQRLEPRRSS